MATLIDVEKVKYTCSCGRKKPLCYLYFCKHCVTLKCKECVLHEIDPKYYCPICFDNKTSKEATQHKYRCPNCLSCPCCKNTLITRASTIAKSAPQTPTPIPTSADGQQAPLVAPSPAPAPLQSQKVFYLVCGFCRWSTREAGVPDATITPGGWKMQENPHTERISQLIESYKEIAMKEKNEKEKKKYPHGRRKAYQSFNSPDVHGILAPYQKILSQTNVDESSSIKKLIDKLSASATTVNSFDPLPTEIFEQEVNLSNVTSIEQRFANPEFQVENATQLYPLNKFFVTKESKRCNVCEHNVIKPDNNITSIKFKLHQMALFMIPEIRICESEVSVTLQSNETSEIAKIIFSEESVSIDRQDTKNAAALKPTDNRNFVCYRKDNKIAILCKVIPLIESEKIICSFVMKHSYYGMSADLQAAPVMQVLTQKIDVDFGLFKAKATDRPRYVDDCLSAPNA